MLLCMPFMKTKLRQILLATLSPLALLSLPSGCASSPDAESSYGDVEGVDAEVTQELQGKPKYSLRSTVVRGEYDFVDNSCRSGYSCYPIRLLLERGKLVARFGDDDRYYGANLVADVWEQNGVLLFSTGGRLEGQGDCDDPGCGNIEKFTGVIYPVKIGGKWVPQIKRTAVVEYLYPDDPDAPEGTVKDVAKLRKAR